MQSVPQPRSTSVLVRSAVEAYFEPLRAVTALKEQKGRNVFSKKRVIVVGLAATVVMTLILQFLTPSVDARVLAKRLSEAAINPENQKNQNDAKEILTEAQQKSIRLPSKVVQEAGDCFLQAAKSTPSAWDVVSQFAGYRSFLDSGKSTNPLPNVPHQYDVQLHFTAPKGVEVNHTAEYARIFCDKPGSDNLGGARAELLAHPKLESANCQHYVMEIRLESASTVAFELDDLFLKNVTLRNSVVRYEGGPVRLENVTFENCKFDFVPGEASQELTRALLISNTVNFAYRTRAGG
jgi:hypothetical protein